MSRSLFEHLDDVTGELTADQSKAALVLELARIETLVADLSSRFGRPGSSRKGIARAFLVKATLNIPATKDLIERLRVDTRLRRLCGFKAKVPSESTFSRAFKAMADSGVLDQAHERAVRAHYADAVVHHVSRDSTAIKVREEPLAKPKPEPREKQKCGRKCKGEVRKRTRQETQAEQSWPESLSELPKGCALGVKKNSKGKQEFWIGYKSHVDVADGGVPLSHDIGDATRLSSRHPVDENDKLPGRDGVLPTDGQGVLCRVDLQGGRRAWTSGNRTGKELPNQARRAARSRPEETFPEPHDGGKVLL